MKKMYMVAIAAMAAFYPAQQSMAQDPDRSKTEMNRSDDDDDDNGKWGLLGLLGLIELAGLKKRDNEDRIVRTPKVDR